MYIYIYYSLYTFLCILFLYLSFLFYHSLSLCILFYNSLSLYNLSFSVSCCVSFPMPLYPSPRLMAIPILKSENKSLGRYYFGQMPHIVPTSQPLELPHAPRSRFSISLGFGGCRRFHLAMPYVPQVHVLTHANKSLSSD